MPKNFRSHVSNFMLHAQSTNVVISRWTRSQADAQNNQMCTAKTTVRFCKSKPTLALIKKAQTQTCKHSSISVVFSMFYFMAVHSEVILDAPPPPPPKEHIYTLTYPQDYEQSIHSSSSLPTGAQGQVTKLTPSGSVAVMEASTSPGNDWRSSVWMMDGGLHVGVPGLRSIVMVRVLVARFVG